MSGGFHCERCGFESPVLTAVSDSLLAIGRERSMTATLRGIVEAVRRLANARAAALGIVEAGSFTRFVTSGFPEDVLVQVGHLPPARGLLGAVIEDLQPIRVPEMRDDPRHGEMPLALAQMGAFMGVPLVSDEGVVGAFYLFGRVGAPAFTAADHDGARMLASHALLAIENARLDERSRELTVVEERNRLARELHDAVSQTLFSIGLMAGSAAALIQEDPEAAKVHVKDLQQLAQEAQREMRSLIFELRPADIERDGLASTLRKHVDVLRRVYGTEIELEVADGEPIDAETEKEIFRVVQEALSNALKHADARHVHVALTAEPRTIRLVVQDDGKGFEPDGIGLKGRRFGLTSMRERVAALGGSFTLDSAAGRGTRIDVEVPRG